MIIIIIIIVVFFAACVGLGLRTAIPYCPSWLAMAAQQSDIYMSSAARCKGPRVHIHTNIWFILQLCTLSNVFRCRMTYTVLVHRKTHQTFQLNAFLAKRVKSVATSCGKKIMDV